MVLEQNPSSPKWQQVQQMVAKPDFKRRIAHHKAGLKPELRSQILKQLFDGCVQLREPLQQISRASHACGVLWEWVCTLPEDEEVVPAEAALGNPAPVEPSQRQAESVVAAESGVEALREALDLAQENCLNWEQKLKEAKSLHVELAQRLGHEFVWRRQQEKGQ